MNDFFGHSITVSGLVTAQDLITQLKDRPTLGERVLIPANMLRHGEGVFLDDYTVEQVEQARQHGRADTVPVGALCQIDGQLRIPVVGRALTNAVRVGVTHDNAVLLADEIRKRSRGFADTARKRLSRRHIIFKRDGCIRYVRLVNLQKRFCIVFCCLANYKFAH